MNIRIESVSKFETLDECKLATVIGGNSADVAPNLKMLRITKGVTQKEVANKINVDVTTVSAYERGLSIPQLDTLIELAKYFDTNLNDIAGV